MSRIDVKHPLRIEAFNASFQAVGKLYRVFKRIRFVRFFELSDPSEAKKSRKILLCAVFCKISLSFRAASAESAPTRVALGRTGVWAKAGISV